MAKGTLFIVSAPSGAGKSSLIDALLKRFNTDDSMRLSISHTTRPPRPNEENHVNYHFVTIEEFKKLISRNAFFEHAMVFDNYYGTSKEEVMGWLNEGKDVLFDIDWQGARKIKEQAPDAVKIFILPPSLPELHRRLIRRGQDNPEIIQKRMSKALSEISHYDEYDYVIINDNFDQSLVQLRSIILSKRQELKMIQESKSSLFEQMQQQSRDYQINPQAFTKMLEEENKAKEDASTASSAETTTEPAPVAQSLSSTTDKIESAPQDSNTVVVDIPQAHDASQLAAALEGKNQA